MPTASATPPRKPNRLRFAFLVFCGVYPLVTALIYILAPLTEGWAVWQRNLIMVPLIVLSMVFVIIPAIQTRLRHWL